jgi:hypothetical protein
VRLARPTVDKIMAAADRLINDRVVSASEDRDRLENERVALLKNEMRLIDAFTTGDIAPSVYRVKTEEFRLARARIAKQVDAASVDTARLSEKVGRTLYVATSMWDLHEPLSDAGRTELLREVFRTVVLSSDGIVGFTLKPPFDSLASAAKGDARKISATERDQLVGAILDAA